MQEVSIPLGDLWSGKENAAQQRLEAVGTDRVSSSSFEKKAGMPDGTKERPTGVVLAHGDEERDANAVLVEEIQKTRYAVSHPFEGVYMNVQANGLFKHCSAAFLVLLPQIVIDGLFQRGVKVDDRFPFKNLPCFLY